MGVEEESLPCIEKDIEFKETTNITKKKRKKKGFVVLPSKAQVQHFVTSILIASHLAANLNYVEFKVTLYIREFHQVIHSPWLLLILACELVYFLSTMISAIDHLLPRSQRPKPPPLEDCPTIDIFIPCCKEPTDIPQDTIMSALAINYPQDRFRVLVLDDGGDDDLRAFCQALQVESGGQLVYLRRPKIQGVPHHFKCGNLNYGLRHSDAKFIVMMDADMILHPSFLRRTLPYIVNSPNVAFVQTPQAYYNTAIGDPLNDSSIFFYNRTLLHRDTISYASCVGTGAIFRRKHLDVIGGFQPQTITEDTMTAFTLFNHGYTSVYVNENLQIGLTPWTFQAYVKQRERWGQGALQQFMTTWKSMLGKKSKLNIVLKVWYFWHTAYHYLSIVNTLLVIILMSALAFRLNFTIGTEDDNRRMLAYLAITIIAWRLAYYSLWFGLPQSVQSRNRDESHFWWMTPIFLKMVVETFFAYGKTFNFVSTSNVDRLATSSSAKSNRPAFLKRLAQLDQVRWHVIYAILVLVVVGTRTYIFLTRYGVNHCKESLYVIGLSFFLVTTCIHVLTPVIYILWPTKFKPSQRKKLIKYDAKGVPRFTEADCLPKWHRSIIFYEIMSYVTLLFWFGTLWISVSGAPKGWCKQGSFF